MFEPFSREDNSMTNATQGTGLGLSIAKSIIAQMGGSIEVKSIQGKGTTFLVRLDLKLVEEEKEADQALLAAEAGDVLVCTVCTELGHLDSRFGRIALTVIIGCRLAAVVAACHYRYNQQQQQRDKCIIPFHSLSVLKLSFTSFFPTSNVTAAPFISGTFMLTCPTGKSKHIG